VTPAGGVRAARVMWGYLRPRRDGMKMADTPELVASAVVKAATEANPHGRYAAGRTARQVNLLRRFVPESAFDRSLRKQMRLPA
jgi:hypothetical protein